MPTMSKRDKPTNGARKRGPQPRILNPEPELGPLPHNRKDQKRPDLIIAIEAAVEQVHGIESFQSIKRVSSYVHMASLAFARACIEDEDALKAFIHTGSILLGDELGHGVRNLTQKEVKIALERMLIAVNRSLELNDDDLSYRK